MNQTRFAMMMGMANAGNERKVFDWEKAAYIIKEHKPKNVEAGLSEDWVETSATIYADGEPIFATDIWLASTWATPVLMTDTDEIECFVMESQTDFNEKTVWPQIALDILRGTDNGRNENT